MRNTFNCKIRTSSVVIVTSKPSINIKIASFSHFSISDPLVLEIGWGRNIQKCYYPSLTPASKVLTMLQDPFHFIPSFRFHTQMQGIDAIDSRTKAFCQSIYCSNHFHIGVRTNVMQSFKSYKNATKVWFQICFRPRIWVF